MNQAPLPSIQGPWVFPCWLLQHFPCPRKNVILACIRKLESRREGTSPVTPVYIYFFSRCTFISSTGVHLFLQIYFLTTASRCGVRSACSQQSAESFYVLESPLCPFKTTKKICVWTQNAIWKLLPPRKTWQQILSVKNELSQLFFSFPFWKLLRSCFLSLPPCSV